jgi:hypothetical protein
MKIDGVAARKKTVNISAWSPASIRGAHQQ